MVCGMRVCVCNTGRARFCGLPQPPPTPPPPPPAKHQHHPKPQAFYLICGFYLPKQYVSPPAALALALHCPVCAPTSSPIHNPPPHTTSLAQLPLVLGLYTACVVVAVACWFYVSLTDPSQPVRFWRLACASCIMRGDRPTRRGGIDPWVSNPISPWTTDDPHTHTQIIDNQPTNTTQHNTTQGGIPCWCMKQTQGHSRYCASCRKSVPGLDHHCLWCACFSFFWGGGVGLCVCVCAGVCVRVLVYPDPKGEGAGFRVHLCRWGANFIPLFPPPTGSTRASGRATTSSSLRWPSSVRTPLLFLLPSHTTHQRAHTRSSQ